MDIHPIRPGHTLVIPKDHAAHLADLDLDDGTHLFRIAQRVAMALRESDIRCEGINLHLSDGEAAGQEVFHVHLHVIPRYAGDGFGLKLPPDHGTAVDQNYIATLAGEIRTAMKGEDSQGG